MGVIWIQFGTLQFQTHMNMICYVWEKYILPTHIIWIYKAIYYYRTIYKTRSSFCVISCVRLSRNKWDVLLVQEEFKVGPIEDALVYTACRHTVSWLITNSWLHYKSYWIIYDIAMHGMTCSTPLHAMHDIYYSVYDMALHGFECSVIPYIKCHTTSSCHGMTCYHIYAERMVVWMQFCFSANASNQEELHCHHTIDDHIHSAHAPACTCQCSRWHASLQ